MLRRRSFKESNKYTLWISDLDKNNSKTKYISRVYPFLALVEGIFWSELLHSFGQG